MCRSKASHDIFEVKDDITRSDRRCLPAMHHVLAMDLDGTFQGWCRFASLGWRKLEKAKTIV